MGITENVGFLLPKLWYFEVKTPQGWGLYSAFSMCHIINNSLCLDPRTGARKVVGGLFGV